MWVWAFSTSLRTKFSKTNDNPNKNNLSFYKSFSKLLIAFGHKYTWMYLKSYIYWLWSWILFWYSNGTSYAFLLNFNPNCDSIFLYYYRIALDSDNFHFFFFFLLLIASFFPYYSCLEIRSRLFLPQVLSSWCRESISFVNTIFLCLLCHLFLYWIAFHFISLVSFLLTLLKIYFSQLNHFSSAEWDFACFFSLNMLCLSWD